MGRGGPSWSPGDIEILISVAETKTIQEICEVFPDRSRKSIERKIEKLRADGKIGYRFKDGSKKPVRSEDSWDDGGWGDKW